MLRVEVSAFFWVEFDCKVVGSTQQFKKKKKY